MSTAIVTVHMYAPDGAPFTTCVTLEGAELKRMEDASCRKAEDQHKGCSVNFVGEQIWPVRLVFC